MKAIIEKVFPWLKTTPNEERYSPEQKALISLLIKAWANDISGYHQPHYISCLEVVAEQNGIDLCEITSALKETLNEKE